MTSFMNESKIKKSSARSVALDLIAAVLQRKTPLDKALASNLDIAMLEHRDRNHARAITAMTLRRLGQIDALIDKMLERPLTQKNMGVKNIIRIGIVQLLFMNTAPHAAVNTSVQLAKNRGYGTHKKLINAVLRRISREGKKIIKNQDEARLNTPDWLWSAWIKAYGEKLCRNIAKAHLLEAPLDITAPLNRALWAEKLDANILSTGTLRRHSSGLVPDLPGFQDGAWWVQDAAAALPVKLLGNIKNKHVIDLCAAPGGKTAQLAHAGAKVTAVDRSEKRIEQLRENMARLKLDVEFITADATQWHPENRVYAVLLDAPCSSTGTIRRHPDVMQLKRPEEVLKLVSVQKRLLEAAIKMVQPGGLIVFCLCSLELEEGPAIARSLKNRPKLIKHVAITPKEVSGCKEFINDDGDLRTLPCHFSKHGGIDGFFATRFQKL